MHRILSMIALLSILAASVYLLLAPTVMSVSAHAAFGGANELVILGKQSLLEAQGSSVLLLLALPVLLVLTPLLLLRGRSSGTGVAALLLGIFSVLGAASIGVFYVPAVLLLVCAALAPERPHARAA